DGGGDFTHLEAAGAFKHQVFNEMADAFFALLFVGTSGLDPHLDGEHRALVAFHQNHFHAVFELIFLVHKLRPYPWRSPSMSTFPIACNGAATATSPRSSGPKFFRLSDTSNGSYRKSGNAGSFGHNPRSDPCISAVELRA